MRSELIGFIKMLITAFEYPECDPIYIFIIAHVGSIERPILIFIKKNWPQ
jgi:hypothetical protein